MTIAQQLRQEGEQKGHQARVRQIAKQMMAKGLDRSLVKDCTQLSDQELDQLCHSYHG